MLGLKRKVISKIKLKYNSVFILTVKIFLTVILLLHVKIIPAQSKPTLSFTFDDPEINVTGGLSGIQKTDALLAVLDKYGLKAALFVCGKRIDNPDGKIIIAKWNDNGHMICNHSYSHSYYHSKKITTENFEYDFLRCDSIINTAPGYAKFFRYPYLKEGDTKEKRDDFRAFLEKNGYRNGYVTIDASDWYIDSRINDTLKSVPDFDITPFNEYYLQHIYNRAMFYDSLAFPLTGRHIKHTLLLHHNALNAKYLGELIEYFISKGWVFTNTSDAYTDEIYNRQPEILPAGESLIWAMAKETGKYESVLRYPGEDSEYEEAALNDYLNQYFSNKK